MQNTAENTAQTPEPAPRVSESFNTEPDLSGSAEDKISALLALADIQVNGQRPWDIQIHNPDTYARILSRGSLGFGESYIEGWWDCDALDEMFTRLLHARLPTKLKGMAKVRLVLSAAQHGLFNFQSRARAFEVGEAHYDIGNELYTRMLDSTMSYSCGYWAEAENLEQAQFNKLDLICRKLKLEPGMSLLDIGCGWGGLAEHAARHYGVKVTGITISKEQKKLAEQRVADLPVEIKLIDYRELDGQFDRIVSVGMFEHVGPKNYRTYFTTAARLLAPEGLFLLHTIGEEHTSVTPDAFIHKYIFPNGKVPSREQITHASLDILRLEDWHNFGPDYDKTLMAWKQNFEASWSEIAEQYSPSFYRMWRYYLCSCAGYFRARRGQLWQLVFSKPEAMGEYRSLR
ncbi:cyclopropane fatty acyl phospholipid synthase [Gilvimarinus sp. DA14]|uniref:cyclopropane fatty acyl phospholipid synthase n=1 Tax=Gilvimarinus sp. DA14 TaxID=2956798 RepID=UPI0020B727AF|nr:cyclopropane fatty acyl phospholipid synthase [Gilvimarinus sp. DA14]UTF59576.1 cyclopropane fatty acyl phospholipid synthase [Gilvimarinus sp. DA14]